MVEAAVTVGWTIRRDDSCLQKESPVRGMPSELPRPPICQQRSLLRKASSPGYDKLINFQLGYA